MADSPLEKKQIRTDIAIAWQLCLFFILSALIIVLTDFTMATGSSLGSVGAL